VRLALFVFLLASASTASAQDVPDAYAAASEVHLVFESEPSNLGIARADGHGGWEQLGLAPCEIVLAPGTVDLALSFQNHAPTRVPIALDVADGERLLGHYESRQPLRELGVGIIVGTLIGMLIGIAIGAGGFLSHTIDVGIGGLVAAGCLGLVGGTTGLALATLDDIATIDVL